MSSSLFRGFTSLCRNSWRCAYVGILFLIIMCISSLLLVNVHAYNDIHAHTCLQFVPQVFNRVCIRALWWSFPPFFCKEGLRMAGSVFRIVVLHEFMPSWIHILYEWNKVSVEYVGVHWSIHSTIENTHTRRSAVTYTCPNVDFHWVLRMRFIPGFLAFFL